MIKEVWFDKEGYTKRIAVNGRQIQENQKDGRKYSVVDENGHVTRLAYDEWDKRTGIVYPDGSMATALFDNLIHRPLRITDENGIVTAYQYDASARMIRKVEGYGTAGEKATEFDYDADGNLIRITLLGDGRTPAAVTAMTYDDAGNLVSLTDPEGNTTTYTHDVMGNVLTRTDGVNHTWTYAYDPAGRLTSVTDPLGHTIAYEYDAVGNRIREVDAQGLEKLYEYDSRNNPVKSTQVMDPSDPDQHRVTRYEYNTDNKLIRRIDPSGKPIAYVYDNEGRLNRSIDGNGNEIHMEYDRAVGGCATCSGGGGAQPTRTVFPTFEQQYGYDLRGRKTLETDIPSTGGDTSTTRFAYDPAGNLIEKTDKEGDTTVYEYDALNRLIGVTDPLTGMTSYEYDGRDNLIALTDAEGNTTRFEYDRNNRLTREIRPMDQQTVYAYDAAGNLAEKTDAKNQKTAYAYDAAGRLVQIDYFTATDHATPQKTVTFTYDASGNLTGYDDGVTSAVYGYDAASRKIAETVNFGPFSKTNGYTYYPNNRKQSFTGPDGQTYTYYYDAADQFTGINIPGAGFIGINEYQWTRPAAMTYPGGMTRSFAYDPLMRATRITSLDPGDPSGQNPLVDYQYDYDKMDNITAKQTEHGDYGYGYDALYRLTAAAPPAGTGLSAEAFTYDGVGNRLTSADAAGPWAYNDNNELTGHDEISYAYDANGNMIQKIAAGNVTSFVYNPEDRLAQVWSGDAGTGDLIAEYYYDPFGRRLWKQVGATRTHYHYSDEGLIAEYDATGNEIKTYGWKPDSTWSTDPLFMRQAGQYYFYHNDHLGTPQKLTDLSGAVVWSAQYESFGKATVETAAVENNLRFPGQYFDAETGLHYNYYRYYDPSTGRYLTPDPLGFEGGDINFYPYAQNNSISFIDPLGLRSDSPTKHYEKCVKNVKTRAKKCECLCVTSMDVDGCEKRCKGCSTAGSDYGLCMCSCKSEGKSTKECEKGCKGFKKCGEE